jgi:hypothetical protein
LPAPAGAVKAGSATCPGVPPEAGARAIRPRRRVWAGRPVPHIIIARDQAGSPMFSDLRTPPPSAAGSRAPHPI